MGDGRNARRETIRTAVVIVCVAVLMAFAGFVLLCARNALDAVRGRDALRLGGVFFRSLAERDAVGPIMAAILLSALVILLCAAVVTVRLVRFVKKSKG